MKTVLISGAGSGIGQATAVQLAAEQMRIVLLGRTESKLQETKKLLENTAVHKIVVADVSSKESVQSGLHKMETAELYAVVANAGIGGENIYGANDRWEKVLATNLSGAYYLVREALPKLKQDSNSYKHIVIMSSVLARLGIPFYSAYCASKAGLLGLMRSLAVELAPDNILVNAICPGWVDTAMAREGIQKYATASKQSYDDALKNQMAQVLLRKMSRPEEIAAFIRFLLSAKQSSFTGQSFDMNNGALMPA